MFGMANLRPEVTGLKFTLHAYKNEDEKARHGPRVKVYPGKPHQGKATVLTVPRTPRDTPALVGPRTIPLRDLARVAEFVKENHLAFLAYWYEPDFDEDDLRAALTDDEVDT